MEGIEVMDGMDGWDGWEDKDSPSFEVDLGPVARRVAIGCLPHRPARNVQLVAAGASGSPPQP